MTNLILIMCTVCVTQTVMHSSIPKEESRTRVFRGHSLAIVSCYSIKD